MQATESYVNERLDHLGIVAGVCQEIGLASWLDAQDPTNRKPGKRGNGNHGDGPEWAGLQQSSIVFSTQYFENKPVEHLLGRGITADRYCQLKKLS